MFISQMIKEPDDHRVFGWMTVMKHRDESDEATKKEIAIRPYRENMRSMSVLIEKALGQSFLRASAKLQFQNRFIA